MRAALYVRIACWTQDQKSARELKSQLEALRNYASRNGMEVVEEFTDAGYSGLRRDRPGLNRMREVAGRRGFDVLLTRDPERLARDWGLQVSLLEELEQWGVRSIFLEGPCRRSAFDVPACDGWGQEELFTVEGWRGRQERGTSCPPVAPPARGCPELASTRRIS